MKRKILNPWNMKSKKINQKKTRQTKTHHTTKNPQKLKLKTKLKLLLLLALFLSLLVVETAYAIEPSTVESWGLDSLQAEKTKAFQQNSEEIVVAIIDTGIDLNHPDLKEKLWTNEKEIPDNHIDDDKNGYVDDVHGWNFAASSNKIQDTQGHGTHIAGIIAGKKTGVAPNIKLMILKYYEPSAFADSTLNSVVGAIEYATKMNAKVINFSAGGRDRNKLEEQAIAAAGKNGILFVAAAGNEKSNTDLSGFFPADYDLPNILSVGAIGKDRNILKVSNFGRRSVDLAAPGEAIISTYPGGGYELMSGTSQATAFATAAAALLLSQNSKNNSLSPQEIISTLSQTGSLNLALTGKTRFAVQVNAYRALAMKGWNQTASGLKEDKKEIDLFFSSDPQ